MSVALISINISNMKRLTSQSGVTAVGLSLTITVVLLLGAIGFGAWAYMERQDYKNNTDQKVAVAVEQAKQVQAQELEKEFTERYKKPLTVYKGPSAFGSIRLKYPKTWSGYVEESSQSSPYLDGYFAPGVVPSKDDRSSVFSLRFEVTRESYSDTMSRYETYVQQGQSKVAPYALPKVEAVVGSKITGKILTNDGEGQGTMIILPLRANSLKVWVMSNRFEKDFNKYILPNLTFSP